MAAVLPEVMFRAGKYLSVPSEGGATEADGNKMIVPPKISASRVLKFAAAFSRDGMSALNGRSANGRRTRHISPDQLALLPVSARPTSASTSMPGRPGVPELRAGIERMFGYSQSEHSDAKHFFALRCASEMSAGCILPAISALLEAAFSAPLDAAILYHICPVILSCGTPWPT